MRNNFSEHIRLYNNNKKIIIWGVQWLNGEDTYLITAVSLVQLHPGTCVVIITLSFSLFPVSIGVCNLSFPTFLVEAALCLKPNHSHDDIKGNNSTPSHLILLNKCLHEASCI